MGNRRTQQRRGTSCLGLKLSLSGDTRKSSITIGDCAIPLLPTPSVNVFTVVWRKKRKLCGSLSKGDRLRYGARHSPPRSPRSFPRDTHTLVRDLCTTTAFLQSQRDGLVSHEEREAFVYLRTWIDALHSIDQPQTVEIPVPRVREMPSHSSKERWERV